MTPIARHRSVADTAIVAALKRFAGVVFGTLVRRATSHKLGIVYAPWTNSADAFLRGTHSGARFVGFGALPVESP